MISFGFGVVDNIIVVSSNDSQSGRRERIFLRHRSFLQIVALFSSLLNLLSTLLQHLMLVVESRPRRQAVMRHALEFGDIAPRP
jgi:hypothetical protein